MKKSGFTLIEILVSITLISIVLVSMLGTLVKLKSVYNNANNDTDIRVVGAIISKTINEDIMEHKGMYSITCLSDGTKCDIVLNDETNRTLSLRTKETISDYTNGSVTGQKKVERTTIEYYDVDNAEVLLIKTVFSINFTSESGTETELVSSAYYHFTKLVSDIYSYTSKTVGKVDKIKTITIETTNSEFDIKILSGGTFAN